MAEPANSQNAKAKIQSALEFLVRQYLKRQTPKLIVITGSVGKTSTKTAIATVLREMYRVRVNVGNHNTHMSVPLAIMGIQYPENIRSVTEWMRVLVQAAKKIYQRKDVDIIVQELGTDTPGDIAHFGTYLKPDIAVVTAVSPEHMEFMGSLTVVAQEELSIAKFAGLTIVNRDDIAEEFAQFAETTSIDTYGLGGVAEYRFDIQNSDFGQGFKGDFVSPELGKVPVTLKVVGEHSIKAAVAGATVGVKLGLDVNDITRGLTKIRPVSGRMQILRGVNNTILIDDTYNSSPLAARAALQTLYSIQAPQRIAILGSMNELGATSKQAHEDLGHMCDPSMLAHVITIGEDAEKYLAPAAIEKGCQVTSFNNPYDAGAFAHKILEHGAVVLAKGSQNKVYAEEALKVLLHNSTEDSPKLVRQTKTWLDAKQKSFFA